MRGKPFPNDHLDQFFNAAVDAGIVLATFLAAADAVGLGTCPISVIRDHSQRVSDMLKLPQRVIPVAGMCVGWPSEKGHISPRLGLSSTLHQGQYDEGNLAERIDAYDKRRAAIHPYKPRDPARWGEVRVLRLVGGQGAAIRRAAAPGLRRVRAPEGFRPGLRLSP